MVRRSRAAGGSRHGLPNITPMHADIRAAVADDIPSVLDLWRSSAAPSPTDSADALRSLLRHDPGASGGRHGGETSEP